MIKTKIERLEQLNEKLYSYDTELKNLATRMSDLHENITTGFYGTGTTAQIKKKVTNIYTRMSKEQMYTKDLASALESCLVFYRNAETNIVESITGKDTYAKVTRANNDVHKKAAEASTKNKYTESKLQTEMEVAISLALSKVGNRYVYGGNDVDNGIDCSGFSQWFYSQLGITLPRTSASQATQGTAVSISNLQPGDLIFYGYPGSGVSHVAIYVGDGKVVHAMNSTKGIVLSDSINCMGSKTVICARRYT